MFISSATLQQTLVPWCNRLSISILMGSARALDTFRMSAKLVHLLVMVMYQKILICVKGKNMWAKRDIIIEYEVRSYVWQYLKRLGYSRTLIRKIKNQGMVFVNGMRWEPGVSLYEGDRVEILLPNGPSLGVEPEYWPFEIVYEDEDVLVVNKESGIVVHPTKGYGFGTLVNALAGYYEKQGYGRAVRPLHRLDKETSGLILFAKDPFVDSFLSNAMEQGEIIREYYALVEGQVAVSEGVIDLPVGRGEEPYKRYVTESGKDSVTRFRVIKRYENCTLLLLNLGSGRGHQIRVHLSHIGHPILGDVLYGAKEWQRVALHAFRLVFPRENGEAEEIVSPLPVEFRF